MVAELKPQTVTRQEISERVRQCIRHGMIASQAGRQVVADLREQGLADALLDLIGPDAVVQIWRDGAPGAPPRIPRPSTPPTAPAPRVVDVEKLKEPTSMLDGMYQIGGRWQRIGDMDQITCRVAAQQFKATAYEHAQTSRYFHALAKTLNGGETVRQRFTDAELLGAWDAAGRRA